MIEIKNGDQRIEFAPGEPGRLEVIENRIRDLEARIALIETQEPPSTAAGTAVSSPLVRNEAEYKAAKASGAKVIRFANGVHGYPLAHDQEGVTYDAESTGKVMFTALVPVPGDRWKIEDGLRVLDSGLKFYQHPARNGQVKQYHRDKMNPHQLVYRKSDGKQVVLDQVFARNKLLPGTYMVELRADGAGVYVFKPGGEFTDVSRLLVARHSHLLTITAGNTTTAGIDFFYGANSAKPGGTVWVRNTAHGTTLIDVNSRFAHGTCIQVGEPGPEPEKNPRILKGFRAVRCKAEFGGVMGWSVQALHDFEMVDCENNGNNTKMADAQWHGSQKFSHDCRRGDIVRWSAKNNNGPGIWFDINNFDIDVDEYTGVNNMGFDSQLEKTAVGITFRNFNISKTRPWRFLSDNGTPEPTRPPLCCGLRLQGNVDRCTIVDGEIEDTEKIIPWRQYHGAMIIFKVVESRGISNGTTIQRVTMKRGGKVVPANEAYFIEDGVNKKYGKVAIGDNRVIDCQPAL